MTAHARITFFATLVLGCTTGAPALQTTMDGGGMNDDAWSPGDAGTPVIPLCPTSVMIRSFPGIPPRTLGWSVEAHGAVEYVAATAISPEAAIVVHATLTSVDAAASRLRLTASTRTLDVTLSPIGPGWLDALPIGELVVAHFENGLVLRREEDDHLLLGLTAGLANGQSPTFDVGPIHVSGGFDECLHVSYDGSYCWSGSIETSTALELGIAHDLVSVAEEGSPRRIVSTGLAYEVVVVATARQATDTEVQPYATSGSRTACAGGLHTATVVAAGIDPHALLACAPSAARIAPTPGSAPVFPGWSVRATGAFAYQETDPAIMDIDGTLAAVDAASSSIDISTVTGTMHVALEPVEPAWLTRLPVGGAVRAHFDHGLVLSESADGSLLLALVQGQGNISSASFDVGPVHVSGDGRPRCIALTQADTSCTVGGTHTDSTFALGAVTATLRAGEAPVPLSDGARAFEVALLGSLRQSSNDELRGIGFGLPCAPALATGTVVRIGLGAP